MFLSSLFFHSDFVLIPFFSLLSFSFVRFNSFPLRSRHEICESLMEGIWFHIQVGSCFTFLCSLFLFSDFVLTSFPFFFFFLFFCLFLHFFTSFPFPLFLTSLLHFLSFSFVSFFTSSLPFLFFCFFFHFFSFLLFFYSLILFFFLSSFSSFSLGFGMKKYSFSLGLGMKITA